MTTDNKTNRGLIICTRIIKYDEVASLVKQYTIKEAVQKVMSEEQEMWRKTNLDVVNGDKNWKNAFLKDCFPKWTYILDGVECTLLETKNAVSSGMVWDIELKVEYDPKLTAYSLLNKKE